MDTEGEDTDTQGVGLTSRRNTRFVSDSLHFTGVDMGDRDVGTRRRTHNGSDYEDEDGEFTSSESLDDEDRDNNAVTRISLTKKEDELVQTALRRIEKAQAKGKADVKLSKKELAALERRRKLMQEEEKRERERERERKKRGSGSGSDRRKKEQRIAVPLTQLEPISRKKRSAALPPPRQDSMGRHASAGAVTDSRQRQALPPMGFFPPPSASRTRAVSGATSSRPASRARDNRSSPPVSYDHLARPRSSRGSPRDEGSTLSSRYQNDPFLYQTAGPIAPYPQEPPAPSRRHVSGPAEMMYDQRRRMVTPAAAAAAARSHGGSRRTSYGDETSEDSPTSEESSSDDRGNGAQIWEPQPPTLRGRGAGIVVEVSPERERVTEKSKKKSSSPIKRKPVSGGSKRKKK